MAPLPSSRLVSLQIARDARTYRPVGFETLRVFCRPRLRGLRLKSLHTVGIAVNISDTETKMTTTGENVHVNTIMSILYLKGWGHAFCLLLWPNTDLVPLPT